MKINSLAIQTDLIFAKFSGIIEDKGSYLVIKTPKNPSFFWGNFIVFGKAPKTGDLELWKSIFDTEFPYSSEPQHYAFIWDDELEQTGSFQEFIDAGFELTKGKVLIASHLVVPPYPNHHVKIQKIETDGDWEAVLELQIACADPKFLDSNYRDFKKKQILQYKEMWEAGMGNWFGAFLGDQLVANLGIFYENKIARYQNVGTHPSFRKQGICGTLVYEAGLLALQEYGVHKLVMEADPDYHAARIYESVGFKHMESNAALLWWNRKK